MSLGGPIAHAARLLRGGISASPGSLESPSEGFPPSRVDPSGHGRNQGYVTIDSRTGRGLECTSVSDKGAWLKRTLKAGVSDASMAADDGGGNIFEILVAAAIVPRSLPSTSDGIGPRGVKCSFVAWCLYIEAPPVSREAIGKWRRLS